MPAEISPNPQMLFRSHRANSNPKGIAWTESMVEKRKTVQYIFGRVVIPYRYKKKSDGNWRSVKPFFLGMNQLAQMT